MHLPSASHYSSPNKIFQGLANNYNTHKESTLTTGETNGNTNGFLISTHARHRTQQGQYTREKAEVRPLQSTH